MHTLLKKLSGGDRRSIGRANEVAADVLRKPVLFRALLEGLTHDDPVIRMRAADALEKVSAERPAILRPHKQHILAVAAESDQQEVRWHMAPLFIRMNLSPAQRAAAVEILLDYLRDKSGIVRTYAMEGLADLSIQDAALKSKVLPLLAKLTEIGTPAMRARGRKLLARLGA
jgi:HEAT repeat protein